MHPDLDRLQPYPFEKLNALKDGIQPPAGLDHIALSIGEPKHPTPAFLSEEVLVHLHGLSRYPTTKGIPELSEAIAGWLQRRFRLGDNGIDPATQVIPVTGTREALFAFAQMIIDRRTEPLVLMPNPFYQIYEGAALLAGAEPRYLPCTAELGFIPDFDGVDEATWDRCQLLYICSPGNPTGAVISQDRLQALIELADRHDFVIAADECYSEIYFDESAPPVGLLQAAKAMGRDDYRRCVVFHSLSKRSNVPGMRSGFVAGDAELLRPFLRYRTYQGCAMPPPHQHASIAAWNDETHVRANRDQYRAKFDAVLGLLSPYMPLQRPDAGFYFWAQTPGSDEDFTRELFAEQNVTVLPGSYLSRTIDGRNPGAGRVRMALVAPFDECIDAARRIQTFLSNRPEMARTGSNP